MGVVSCLKGKKELTDENTCQAHRPDDNKRNSYTNRENVKSREADLHKKTDLYTIHNHADDGIRATELLRCGSITSLASTASY